MKERHSVSKHFLLTPSESKALARHAAEAELNESEYVRALIRDPSRVFTTSRDTLTKIYKGVRKAGVNLNQIAWKINSGHAGEVRRADVERIAETFDRMLELLEGALRSRGRL